MTARRAKRTPAEEAFARVIAAHSRVLHVTAEPGWRAGNTVLKVGTKIFAMLDHGRFVAKLPAPRIDELIARGAGARFRPRRTGSPMREWFVAASASDWTALSREARRFVAGTRPKSS